VVGFLVGFIEGTLEFVEEHEGKWATASRTSASRLNFITGIIVLRLLGS